MARQFNELIKKFNSLRPYARDFYINGFKSREEFQAKSLRSYDNERRRIESFLSQSIESEYGSEGKQLRLNFAKEKSSTNPLFSLWETKSFTKNDIFLHFTLMDCLQPGVALTLPELSQLIHTHYLHQFSDSVDLTDQTIRNKLKEYSRLGILKETPTTPIYYQLKQAVTLTPALVQALYFYQEVLPVGVIGHYLLQQSPLNLKSHLAFKHHFMVHTLDDEITLTILTAIKAQRWLRVTQINGSINHYLPFKIYDSTETGRQYLVAKHQRLSFLSAVRIDLIEAIELGSVAEEFQSEKEIFEKKRQFNWNGSFNNRPVHFLRVVFKINEQRENFVFERLIREQRMGKSQRLNEEHVLFEIELTDLFALNPFLRTFIGRIVSIETDDLNWKLLFLSDLKKLTAIYLPQIKNGESI